VCQKYEGEIIFIKQATSEALAPLASPFSLKKVIYQLVIYLTLHYTINLTLLRRIVLQRCTVYTDFSLGILSFELRLLPSQLFVNLLWFDYFTWLTYSGGLRAVPQRKK
jgi:hypothetical protein